MPPRRPPPTREEHKTALHTLTSHDETGTITLALPYDVWEALTIDALQATPYTAAWTCYQCHGWQLVTYITRPGINRAKPHPNLITPTPKGLACLKGD